MDALRWLLVFVVGFGAFAALFLIGWLAKKHPFYLSSPTELTEEAQQLLMNSEEQGEDQQK